MTAAIPRALLEHAAFAPYRDQEFHYGTAGNAVVPTFILPPARHLSAIEFERRIVERNELVVRPENLHDLMNALVWMTFPLTKRAISETHVALGVTADGRTRPRRRDVLTLFDEAGIMLLSERDDLVRLHQAQQWRALFVHRRQDFVRDVRPILFGHGSLEQLGSNPHRGLTVKALWLPFPPDAPLSEVDQWLADRIVADASLTATERRLPLPLLGIPGWFGANEDPRCYDEIDVFRPLRMARNAGDQQPGAQAPVNSNA